MSLKISRILHAGYVLECEGTQIAFDTIFENPFSRNCHAFPQVEFDREQIKDLKFDAVFISHHHDDHCSLESLNLLNRETPVYMYCLHEELFQWIRELGFQDVIPLSLNKSVQVGSFEIIPRRALDADVDSLFQIKAAGLNVLNVVDSWIDYDTLDLLKNEKPWDLIMWPFQTMRELEVIAPKRFPAAPGELPPEWIEQLKVLNPRALIPSSCQFKQEPWSWYNQAFFPISYKQFQSEINEALPETTVVRLDPAQSIELVKGSIQKASPLRWIRLLQDSEVDYDYQPNLVPPSTAQVSQNFPALTAEQVKRVQIYCEQDLLHKYRSMDEPSETYFQKPRRWQLTVYDHRGSALQYHYELRADQIELVTKSSLPVGWTTEVSAFKLHAALNAGETLTSMYMRVNDIDFSPDIEAEMQEVDIVEDPLIRCLFTQEFGSYQFTQLQRLKSISLD